MVKRLVNSIKTVAWALMVVASITTWYGAEDGKGAEDLPLGVALMAIAVFGALLGLLAFALVAWVFN